MKQATRQSCEEATLGLTFYNDCLDLEPSYPPIMSHQGPVHKQVKFNKIGVGYKLKYHTRLDPNLKFIYT